MTNTIIKAVSITKQFYPISSHYSLKNVVDSICGKNPVNAILGASFTVNKGEKVAVTGNNGSGKTTLLRILHKIYPITNGSLMVNGKTRALFRSFLPAKRNASVIEHMRLLCSLYGYPEKIQDQSVSKILDWTNLESAVDSPVKNLSSGQTQMLCLGIVLFAESDILIIDEGPTYLDSQHQKRLEQKLINLGNQGTTLIISSHDTGFLKRTCNRQIHLEKGRLINDGLL